MNGLDYIKMLVEQALMSISMTYQNKISVSTYYELIKSGEDIDRYEDVVEDMINDANNEDKKAWIVIVQTDDGEITYITKDVASYDFEFDIKLYTKIEYQDEMYDIVKKVIDKLSKENHQIVNTTTNMAFSNPNIEMPDIINDYELITISTSGSCSIYQGNVLTNKDLIDVRMSIPSLNIPMTEMPIISNLPKYSTNPENIQTKTSGYYTDILTYRVGIENVIRIVCDLNNPICNKLFELCKKRIDNPTFKLKVDEKVADLKFSTERVVNSIDLEVTDNGVVLLSISTFVVNNTTFEEGE